MNVIWFLLPLSILLGLTFLLAFIWSVKKGQLDDMETPAYRMLLDEENCEIQTFNTNNDRKGKRT